MNSILVVEDDSVVRKNILQFLKMEGYVVKEASNGLEAIGILENFYPSLIISDVMMPEMGGYELLGRLQKNPVMSKIPFIFLTARVDDADVRNGMSLGADDYITKPFRLIDLLRAVETRLRKKEQSRNEIEEIKMNISLYVPHELRTPLVSIMGYTDLLLDELDDLSKDEIKEMLWDIKSSNRRLHKLIEKFLLYAQLNLDCTSNQLDSDLFYSKYDSIKDLISEEILELNEAAVRIDDIKLNIAAEPPNIQLKHLRFMLSELMENSIKFSDRGSPIEVDTMKNGDFCLLIKDYGRGMTPDQIQNISLFKQFDRNVYQQSGNGLGIAITKKIINLYGGEFKMRSEKDRFTEVEVRLPNEIKMKSEEENCSSREALIGEKEK